MMQSTADDYNALGLSVVPTNEKKQAFKWKESQERILKLDFSHSYGMALVCGRVSGNVEVIDFDTKYDLTGTLMNRYRELVNSYDPSILKKLVWQKSQSGGFHAFYKCEKIEGNHKLAQREATDEEKAKGDKINVLIETRGEGGYVCIAPTPHYEVINGTLAEIPTITPHERETLFNCAVSFNEYFKTEVNYVVKKMVFDGKSPLDDYDERGDCVRLLVRHGWSVVKEQGPKILLKRPGSTQAAHSGNFDRDKNWFSVFTTSSEFDAQKAYKPSGVYCILECSGDFHETAKRLVAEGYGERKQTQVVKKEVKSTIVLGDTEWDYVATASDMDNDLQMWRDGTFPMGLSWGIPELDEFHRLKRGQFNMMNGLDNVGKSTIMWYLSMISACLHNWRWVIFSTENKFSTVKKRLIEFYWGQDIKSLNDLQYKVAYKFVDDHFKIIKCNRSFTYVDVLNMVSNIHAIWKVDGLLLDPYNSLIRETNGGRISTHDYDYDAASIMQTYTKANDITMYINCHTISNANRQKDNDGNPSAPLKADTEGGSKWSNKADDFLTGHRLVYSRDKYREMQIYIRKVKETETGGRNSPLAEPVILTMYGHYGFKSISGVDPIENWRKKQVPQQVEIKEEPPKAIKPNVNFSSSADLKEQSETGHPNNYKEAWE